ncbi:uncharacterized protein SEPMUDRAFT_148099 [Sphaerulina musiva SO2202]|uniref:Uncharacterized protein n=1 Tax=Sphaerulina musiva (strain SO2202) TaxID=692275 RepID=M3C276_SPHMS|nr:uncharacterized protein SEPMUDRAFT_148099 [Sphaerulina musiva SO2202]EMF14376.1 hypothetical protein SEPMUDRAFT_148099 [Sphaerulina musiva SO2202]
MRLRHFEVQLQAVDLNNHVLPVPLQEFAVKYCEYADNRLVDHSDITTAPLMTAKVPALPLDHSFEVHIQSWVHSPPFLYKNDTRGGACGPLVWRVKTTVDGAESRHWFDAGTTWPLVLVSNFDGPLRFPQYRREISNLPCHTAQPGGRIKVEIQEGRYLNKSGDLDEFNERFQVLAVHGIFSFQYVPLDILQRDGIAWPNHQHRLEIAPHLRHLNLVPSLWRSPADPSRFEWEFLPARRDGNGDRDTSRAIASSWSLRDILGGPPPAPGGGPSGLTLPPILDRVGNPAPVEAPLPRLSAAFSYQPTPAPTSDALERLRTYPLP